MKTVIDIKGVITNIENTEITEKQYGDLWGSVLELIESKGYYFGGGTVLCSVKDL